MFSAFLSSVARCNSSSSCAICFFASKMPSSKALILDSSSAILASRSALKSSFFAVVISFSWISASHQSFFLTSSDCCVLSMEIMSSIACFTLVNASSSTDVAKIDNCGLCMRRAAFRKASAAAWRRLLWRLESTCTKPLNVLLMASRASSPWRISIVSATACISAKRVFLRSSKFARACAQVSFKFFKYSWSSARTLFS
mmetsp:Transcript_56382/g.142625  ORF Transcript_56382/g.142625 Transcript_56382/m.142625 type:complete len:200 (-) Transcript_56382:586-1185(-)